MDLELPLTTPSGASLTLAPGLRHRAVLNIDEVPALLRPGHCVYVPGASGAPQAFMEALQRQPQATKGARLLTTYVPGINRLQMGALDPTCRISGLFMQPGLGDAQRDGRYRAMPMSYAGFNRHLAEEAEIDLAVLQLSPPDAYGLCSMGPAVEFMPTVLRKARRRIGIINHCTPALRASVQVHIDSLDYVCEVEQPLPVYEVPVDAGTQAIARHIAPLIADGSVLQTGLGKVPTALAMLLRDRRMLRLHSGLLSDGMLDLARAGALDMDFKHTTCALVGSAAFYAEVADFAPLRVRGCEYTHASATLASFERFVTVNSALEVDLFGQCNLEHANGKAMSGAGGAPDFARAGRLSPHGCSIIALHACHKHGSRILPTLTAQSITTLPRVDVDYIVTEHGVACLKGASVHERAEAIIGVAAPEHRAALQESWRAIAARL